MKKIFIVTILTVLAGSCKKNSSNETSNEIVKNSTIKSKELVEEVEKKATESIVSTRDVASAKVALSSAQFEKLLVEFKNCKALNTKRSDCRNAITKFISQKFQLNEFKDEKGNFKVYDSIFPIVSSSSKWKKIGLATSQDNLNEALDYANNGGLALIIDTSKTYGHVVMVQPGKTTNSGSWGLKLPNVLSLLNSNPSKSFQGKSLAYAIKKNNNLEIFIRN